MDEPTTKPSGSNPASPSSTYSETDKSEVKTPDGSAPAVCASLLSAACGSQAAASPAGLLAKSGMGLILRPDSLGTRASTAKLTCARADGVRPGATCQVSPLSPRTVAGSTLPSRTSRVARTMVLPRSHGTVTQKETAAARP